MEEGAVGIVRFLAVLDLPLGLVAIPVGVLTMLVFLPRRSEPAVIDLGLVERLAVGLCGGVAMLGILGTVETVIEHRFALTPMGLVFAAVVVGCGWPALAWRSRWRASAEGGATALVATMAILSGFTIGFLFVPLVALMLWLCVWRLFRAFRRRGEAAPVRVDSLP